MNEQRQPIENVFHTTDEQQLFYRHWPAINQNSARKAIILFHRGHEHSGRLQHIVDELNLPDTDFYAWGARGHGRSPGERIALHWHDLFRMSTNLCISLPKKIRHH